MISMSRCPCVPKAAAGCDAVLVDDAQRPEAHVPRVVSSRRTRRCGGSRASRELAWPRSSALRMVNMGFSSQESVSFRSAFVAALRETQDAIVLPVALDP